MDHPTTTWARLFGLPDPGVPADAVLASSPGQIRDLAARCRSVAGAVRDGTGFTERAEGALQQGWTSPAAWCAVQGLARSAAAVSAMSAAAGAAISGYADEIERARTAVHRAYAQADATISAEGLLNWGLLGADGGRLVELNPRRCAVVRTLNTAVDAAVAQADRAGSAVVAAVGPDPRAGLPTGLPLGPVGSARNDAERLDAANRAALAADLMSSSARHRLFAQRVRSALLHAAGSAGRPVELLGYDPDRPNGQGGAAIAIGDVSTADSVAVLVPGVANSPADMAAPLDTASSLTGAAAAAAPGSATATIVWLGYDVPLSWLHDAAVPTPGHAVADSALAVNAVDASVGGAELAAFCRHLRGAMDSSAGLTLIGHSYGSTVVSQAALRLDRDAGVDDIVLLASPGAGYGLSTARDYRAVPADHVYALAFPRDPIPSAGTDLVAGIIDPLGNLAVGLAPGTDGSPFGPDPASAGYGAQVIDAPSNTPVAHGGPSVPMALLAGPAAGLLAAHGLDPVHNMNQHAIGNYLQGAALSAVAAVVVGSYAKVPVRSRR